jgi:hypothetical protein
MWVRPRATQSMTIQLPKLVKMPGSLLPVSASTANTSVPAGPALCGGPPAGRLQALIRPGVATRPAPSRAVRRKVRRPRGREASSLMRCVLFARFGGGRRQVHVTCDTDRSRHSL